MHLDTRIKLFMFLIGVFVTALVIGDIIGGKLVEVHLGSQATIVSVGMIPFPITFLLTDILNEFYGKSAARYVTLVGFAMSLFCYAVIFAAVALPWAPLTREAGYGGMVETSFNNVFLGSQRILVASMIAFLLGQFLDIGVFNLLKRVTSNRYLWLRATGSTVVSQLVDTIVIQCIAWWGILSPGKVASLALSSYVIKLLVAIGLTPLIYAGHTLVHRALGLAPIQLDANGEVIEGPPAL